MEILINDGVNKSQHDSLSFFLVVKGSTKILVEIMLKSQYLCQGAYAQLWIQEYNTSSFSHLLTISYLGSLVEYNVF